MRLVRTRPHGYSVRMNSHTLTRQLFRGCRLGVVVALVGVGAVACGGTSNRAEAPTTTGKSTIEKSTTTGSAATQTSESTTTASSGSSSTTAVSNGGGGTAGPDCWVQFYQDFNQEGPDYKLTEPGRHTSLSGLPGADSDWTGRANSLRVGDAVKATVWAKKNFTGDSRDLKGGAYPVLGFEPSSIEMSCG